MQRLREQFSKRKQSTIDQTGGSEPVTPARSTSQFGHQAPISDPHPTSSHNLFRFPSNSSTTSQQQPQQTQKSPKKSVHAQKARKQMLRQQAHSLPQSPPVKSSSKHPPLAYHESQTEMMITSHHNKEIFYKDFKDKQSNIPSSSSMAPFKYSQTNQPPLDNQQPTSTNIQSLQKQIHYKRNLMTTQMQIRYQQLPRHQRVNQSFSSSQHMMPSSPILQTENRSASFEEIRNVKENKMIYEENSIEAEDTNLSLSESNSSSLHNLHTSNHPRQISAQNTVASCCSSTGSINVQTFVGQNLLQQQAQTSSTCQSYIIRNPTVFTLASTKSSRSKSFDCCQAQPHTLQAQQSLQDKIITNNVVGTTIGNSSGLSKSSNIGFINSNINSANLIKEQYPQQTVSGLIAVRCSTPQPISNIQAISTASISSIASDSPSKKRGPFLEIPKWRMLIRRTTTSNQLSAQHRNAEGMISQTAQQTITNEFSPPNSAFEKQTINFERECVHCALLNELSKLSHISSRGTSTHTSLSSLEDSDSEQHLIMQKNQQFNLSKSGDYFDLSSSIKELDTLSKQIDKLELDSSERFSSQFAKCSSGNSEKSGSSSGKETSPKVIGANCDSLDEDFYTHEETTTATIDKTKQQIQTNLQTNQKDANAGDLSKSVSFNDGEYCENCAAEHTSTSNSRNASLISLPMVTLSLPSSESDDQITSLASIGQSSNYQQQASNSNQFHSPPISPPPFSRQQEHSVCCKNKNESNEFEQANNSSCITVVSLTVPVLANKSGRSASVDSSYLKVPQRTDIGTYEAPPARGGQRSKSVDISLPIGPDGPYIVVPSIKPQQMVTQ